MKKSGLDPTEAGSYRVPTHFQPVGSFQIAGTSCGAPAAGISDVRRSSPVPPLQSGFRPGHSTESASVLRVLSDILLAVDRGDFAAVVLLDLSAAFDTVDHCYAASVTSSQQPSFNLLSLCWSSAGWTTVTVRWLVCQPILSVDSSRFRTQRQGSYSGSVAMTTLLTRSSVSTGYECRKGSCSRLPCRHTIVMLRSIFGSSPPWPTRRPDKDSGLHPPGRSCLSRLSDFLLLDVAPSLLLVLAYGTIYLWTLPPHRRCLHLSVI